jgi:hypothetical protein
MASVPRMRSLIATMRVYRRFLRRQIHPTSVSSFASPFWRLTFKKVFLLGASHLVSLTAI